MSDLRERAGVQRSGDEAAWLAVSGLIYLPVIAVSMAWVVWFHGWEEAAHRQVGEVPLLAALVGLALGVGFAVLSQSITPRMAWGRAMADALSDQLGGLSPKVTLTMALLSSVGEEWVFRGVLQPAIGLVPASLLFGLVHIPTERALRPWPILAFGMGLVMGGLYSWFGGLVAPIAMHFALNALNLRWLAARTTAID